jgi:hypothetical protein
LTLGRKEDAHADTDYHLGVGFRGRRRVLRSQPLGLRWGSGHRAGYDISDPPYSVHVGDVPLRRNLSTLERTHVSSHNVVQSASESVCAKVKHLGYAASQTIKLYGEEFLAVSDPFLDGNGVALRVTTTQDPSVGTIRLPSTILQGVMGGIFTNAAQ